MLKAGRFASYHEQIYVCQNALYLDMLTPEFIQGRMESTAKDCNIGPAELKRCLAKGKARSHADRSSPMATQLPLSGARFR